MALLACGLVWPWLMLIIAPLFIASILNRLGLKILAPIAAAAVLAVTCGIVGSWYYWHYPFRPPPLLAELRSISAVVQLSAVNDLNPERDAPPQIDPLFAVPPPNSPWMPQTEIDPLERILLDLYTRKIGIESAEPVSQELLNSIWQAADRAGLLFDGTPERTNTKSLRGHVGIARLKNGNQIAFATLTGDEYSNDHYPYYELVVYLDDPKFEVANSLWFFYDVAGIEGMSWERLAAGSFVFLGPISIVLQLISAAMKQESARLSGTKS
jgi:hypothetical protein